ADAGCIASQRLEAGGRVVAAACVVKERNRTNRRVVAAGSVASECIHTISRIPEAGCVAIERISTNGRVVLAGCEAEERTVTLSGVGAEIASVRCWGWENRLRCGRKRKAAEHEGNENKSTLKRR